MSIYSNILKPVLFQFEPEWIHDQVLNLGEILGSSTLITDLLRKVYCYDDLRLKVDVCGVAFPNPVGLAAGFDKNGRALKFLSSLGFGFLEIGSVSYEFSLGNPKPRLFRLPLDQASVVYYGLPNEGAPAISNRLKKIRPFISVPLGINIVNTNRGIDAPFQDGEEIIRDYMGSIHLLQSYADYLCLNLSCPNTESGEDFFLEKQKVQDLLSAIEKLGLTCPLFLKVSPAGGEEGIETLLEAVDSFKIVSGFVFNLPRGKPKNLLTSMDVVEKMPGAVSGRPVKDISNNWIQQMYRRMDKKRYKIIGTGGIFSAEDAYEKLKLGASLVQVLTSLPYKGPALIKKINKGICRLLERDGFQSVSEVVGTDNRGRL